MFELNLKILFPFNIFCIFQLLTTECDKLQLSCQTFGSKYEGELAPLLASEASNNIVNHHHQPPQYSFTRDIPELKPETSHHTNTQGIYNFG